MANRRVFQVQQLVTNGVAVGGLSTLSFEAAFRDIVRSSPDGAIGIEDVDRAGLRVGVSLETTDVTKVNALLDSTPGETTFRAKESGAATYHNYTIAATEAVILWHAMSITLAKAVDATLRLDGTMRFIAGTKTLGDVISQAVANAGAPSLAYPTRLYRPNTVSFDPDGAGAAIAIAHADSLSLSLSGVVIEDYSDADIGETAVDLAGWNDLQVTANYRDAGDSAVATEDITAALLGAARGVLTATILGRAGAANKTLTINNLLWTAPSERHKADYSDFALQGVCGWKNGETTYGLNSGTKLFAFA